MDKHECNCHENENGCNCNENEDVCNCGGGHDHEEVPVITLALENNTELECAVAGVFSYKEKDYIALVPVDEEVVLFYLYEELGKEMSLNNIEDDEEYEKIADYFYQMSAMEE